MNRFCHKCGKKLEETEKYCPECGTAITIKKLTKNTSEKKNTEESWWLRLAKVIYIVLYLPLLAVIPITWSINAPSCNYTGTYCSGSYVSAFWYSLLVLAIYAVIVRLIKISFLYIAVGQSPEWGKELAKPF